MLSKPNAAVYMHTAEEMPEIKGGTASLFIVAGLTYHGITIR